MRCQSVSWRSFRCVDLIGTFHGHLCVSVRSTNKLLNDEWQSWLFGFHLIHVSKVWGFCTTTIIIASFPIVEWQSLH